MMGQRLTAVAFALLAPVLLSACSGSGTQAPPSAGVVQAVVTEAPPQPTSTPEGPHIPTVVLDPGHGGEEVGAANYGVVEKHSNLDMALRIERLLQAEGVHVILTRREDTRVASRPGLGSTFGSTRFDLQARIDIANSAEADLFLAIHSNGSPSGDQSGVEVWFDPNREFGEQNRTLAQTIQDNVLRELAAYGYSAVDRGIKDDTCFRQRSGRCFPLFVLGSAPHHDARRAATTRRQPGHPRPRTRPAGHHHARDEHAWRARRAALHLERRRRRHARRRRRPRRHGPRRHRRPTLDAAARPRAVTRHPTICRPTTVFHCHPERMRGI